MSIGIDIKYVQERYAQMSDDELTYTVTSNASGLTPEALEVAREEVRKRGLDLRLIDVLEVQNKELTADEINGYCELVRNLNCPVCGSKGPLSATLAVTHMSFFGYGDNNEKLIHVACPSCLVEIHNAALRKTMFLGWWDVPSGVIKSIRAIRLNKKNRQLDHTGSVPNEYLKAFVMAKLVQLELHKDQKGRLQSVIAEALEMKSNAFGIVLPY